MKKKRAIKKRKMKKFLETLNSKRVIGLLIFVILSLVMVLAGNVIFKEGSVDIENNLNVSNILFVNQTTGNVGIGTTNPLSKLSVGGDGYANTGLFANGSSYGMYATAYGYGEGNGIGVYGYGSGGNGVGLYGVGTVFGVLANGSSYGVYSNGGTYDFYGGGPKSYFAGNIGIGTTNPSYKLEILNTSNVFNASNTLFVQGTGRVGIGTASPVASLHVSSSSAGALPASSGSTQSGGLRIRLSTAAASGIFDIGTAGGSGMWLQSTDSGNLATNYPLLLNPNGGNVGIGTTTPGEKLDINGAMHLTPQASPPTTANSGDLYVDSTPSPDELCVYDGSAWQGILSGTDANCA